MSWVNPVAHPSSLPEGLGLGAKKENARVPVLLFEEIKNM